MTLRLCLVLILLLAALWGPPAAAQSRRGCEAIRLPAARVAISAPQVVLDHSRSLDQLDARRSHAGWRTTGITSYELESAFSATFEFQPIGNGRGCLRPSAISPRLKVLKHVIYIAREFPKGSCEYRSVLAHERRHAAINTELRNAFAEGLRRAFDNAAQRLRRARPIAAADFDRVARRELARWKRLFRRIEADHSRGLSGRQARIDTAAEYLRVQRSCGPNSRLMRLAAE